MALSRPPGPRGLGYAEVLLAASLWGSSGIFATKLFRMGMDPEGVALLRPLVGLAFLAAAVLAWRRSALHVPPGAAGVLLGLGGLATASFQLSYLMSMEAVGVPATVALLYLAPAIVLAASGPLLGERPSRGQIACALLSVTGVWLTVLHGRGDTPPLTGVGAVWGVAAAASYAGYTLFGRYAAPRWGAVPTVLHSTAGACVILVVALPAGGRRIALPPDAAAWALLLLFGLLTIAVATFLFYDALGRIEAGPAAVTSTVEPVVAALLATWLLGQGLAGPGWAGLGMVVAGVAGSYAFGRRDARRTAPTLPVHE